MATKSIDWIVLHSLWIATIGIGIACAGKSRAPVIRELIGGDTVCIHFDWGGPAPHFGGYPLPDSVNLLPKADGNEWGQVVNRFDSAAGRHATFDGWRVVSDTLIIETLTPPMDDFVLWAPHGALWAGQWGRTGLVRGECGLVSLEPIRCADLAEPTMLTF
jgi:hypothetical protein